MARLCLLVDDRKMMLAMMRYQALNASGCWEDFVGQDEIDDVDEENESESVGGQGNELDSDQEELCTDLEDGREDDLDDERRDDLDDKN